MEDPILVERIEADGGIDIGQTFDWDAFKASGCAGSAGSVSSTAKQS